MIFQSNESKCHGVFICGDVVSLLNYISTVFNYKEVLTVAYDNTNDIKYRILISPETAFGLYSVSSAASRFAFILQNPNFLCGFLFESLVI